MSRFKGKRRRQSENNIANHRHFATLRCDLVYFRPLTKHLLTGIFICPKLLFTCLADGTRQGPNFPTRKFSNRQKFEGGNCSS